MKLSSILKIALEDIADGKTHIEKEHVFYVYISDLSELDKAASKELQIQWEIKIPKNESNLDSGCIRSRASMVVNGTDYSLIPEQTKYTITSKVKTGESNSKLETTMECPEDVFNMFSRLANSGMRKVRHNFPIEGTELIYEVDVYFNADNTFANWCKIDLEVKSDSDLPICKPGMKCLTGTRFLPPFPFVVSNCINQTNDNTPEEKVKIRELYDTVFLKNVRTSV